MNVTKQPVGDEPGGGKLRGRQSGRLSPRTPLRPPRREQVEAAHGLRSAASIDPLQAQLFDTSHIERTQEEIASAHGLPAPTADTKPGFLPGVRTIRPTKAHKAVAAERNAAGAKHVTPEDVARRDVKRKTIESFASVRSIHPVPGREDESAIAASYKHNIGLGQAARDSSWYMGPAGTHGDAPAAIDVAAERTRTSPVEMTRAVAITSPRTAWDQGNPIHRTMPNIESAENVAHAVRSSGVSDAEEARQVGHAAFGQALGARKALAAEVFSGHDPVDTPVRVGKAEHYKKVPSFNQNLLAGRTDVPGNLRASYSAAYTQDAWDLSAQHLPERLHDSANLYDVSATTAQRAAYRTGRLPMNAQAATWAKHRAEVAPEPLTLSAPDSRGRYRDVPSLLEQHGDHISPQFDFHKWPQEGHRHGKYDSF